MPPACPLRLCLRPRSRVPWIAALALFAGPGPAVAQSRTLAERTATPEAVTTLFLRSVRAIRWSAATQFISAETLARFREVVSLMADADTTGETRRYLARTDKAEYDRLPAAEVFDRAVGRMIDDMPGLMHALFDHDDEVIGHVAEGADRAFVVYRTVERLSGAVPEVRVIETVRTPAGWRVLWSDELAVLETALRGIPARAARIHPPRPPSPTSPRTDHDDADTNVMPEEGRKVSQATQQPGERYLGSPNRGSCFAAR